MDKIINMTPHPITVILESGEKVVFESEGQIRLKQNIVKYDTISGIPITHTEYNEVEGLPEMQMGGCRFTSHCNGCPLGEQGCPDYSELITTFYIVSRMVRDALPDRKDLLVPSELVRDEKGVILGCKSLDI